MKKIILFALIPGIALLTSCGGGSKKENDKKDSVKTEQVKKTAANLKEAIKGETTASAKYAKFAEKAKEEGYLSVAKLFEAASQSESIHAKNHTKVLEEMGEKMEDFKPEFEVKTTKENLEAAIAGETKEYTEMYPGFIKTSDEEGIANASKSFGWAKDTEMKHAEYYKKALEALNAKKEKSLAREYNVCPKCGYTYEAKSAPANCDLCGTAKEKFILIK